jgi:hypothetical protein
MHSTFRMMAMLVLVASASQATAQVVVYRSAPVISYYSPPVVSYYTPPVVSYYSPPTLSYYTPAYTPTMVTTYQGILPWRRYTVTTYGVPMHVSPAPATRYYYIR